MVWGQMNHNCNGMGPPEPQLAYYGVIPIYYGTVLPHELASWYWFTVWSQYLRDWRQIEGAKRKVGVGTRGDKDGTAQGQFVVIVLCV